MKRILVVEDERDIRDVLTETLHRWGYETQAAENGKEGLDKFQAETFSMVITDIRMPVMDGLEMLKQIKRKNPMMPIIVVTGYPSVDSAVDCLAEGADYYIVKPINMDDLKVKIGKSFEQQQIQHALSFSKKLNKILMLSIPVWLFIGWLISRLF